MKKKRLLLISCLALLMTMGLAGTSLANFTYVIDDSPDGPYTYWGGRVTNGNTDRDVIYEENEDVTAYHIDEMTVFSNDDGAGVKIKTNMADKYHYRDLLRDKVRIGDLFISTNGWHPREGATAPHYPDDYQNPRVHQSEEWEYVIVLDEPGAVNERFYEAQYIAKLYKVNNSKIIYSSNAGHFNCWRKDQEIFYDPGTQDPNQIGKFSFIDNGKGMNEISIFFPASNSQDSNSQTPLTLKQIFDASKPLAVKYGQTCGKDMIVGNAVPVPPSLLLLGTGLIGMIGFRKKSKGAQS